MDGSRTPWWLTVLLMVAVTSLAIWQSPRWTKRVRWGAGGLALVYLALLSYAVGGDSQGISSHPATPRPGSAVDELLVVVGGLCIVAAVFLFGRPALRGQLAWFAILSVGNAGLCFMTGNSDMGCALSLVGAMVSIVLVKKLYRAEVFRPLELLPAAEADSEGDRRYTSWLTGGTGFLLALVLVGTFYYAAHAETTRATASRRHSALPTRARISSVLASHSGKERSDGLSDLAFGRRADIVVLLSILTFVSLASTMTEKG